MANNAVRGHADLGDTGEADRACTSRQSADSTCLQRVSRFAMLPTHDRAFGAMHWSFGAPPRLQRDTSTRVSGAQQQLRPSSLCPPNGPANSESRLSASSSLSCPCAPHADGSLCAMCDPKPPAHPPSTQAVRAQLRPPSRGNEACRATIATHPERTESSSEPRSFSRAEVTDGSPQASAAGDQLANGPERLAAQPAPPRPTRHQQRGEVVDAPAARAAKPPPALLGVGVHLAGGIRVVVVRKWAAHHPAVVRHADGAQGLEVCGRRGQRPLVGPGRPDALSARAAVRSPGRRAPARSESSSRTPTRAGRATPT
jgi:hypothetical protein